MTTTAATPAGPPLTTIASPTQHRVAGFPSLPFLALSLFLMAQPNPAIAQDPLAPYQTPANVPVRVLDATKAFEGLTPKEKSYAYWMSEASWRGALICFHQASEESPDTLEFLLRLYQKDQVRLRKLAHRRGLSDRELDAMEQYAARFCSNTGNYLSFGDTKFVPNLSPEAAASLVDVAANMGPTTDQRLLDLWERTQESVWSLEPSVRAIGMGDEGISAYYGRDITAADAELAKEAMRALGIEAWNTRLFRDKDGHLLVRIASVDQRRERHETQVGGNTVVLHVEYGDYSEILASVVSALRNALPYAANPTQAEMIGHYIAHFQSGHIAAHKDSQKAWVADKGPVVETNLGFIETYRDPIHVRAEWEGLVAIVNKEQSARFQRLVDEAPDLMKLPWPAAFEKDTFRRPDFTSLEVLCFANGGIPAGINIPNYDEIRLEVGFKNVSLGNVLAAGSGSDGPADFVCDSDQDLFKRWKDPAFEVQVGLHELLGHGSGKLLMEEEGGKRNFDPATTNPLTQKPVHSWYKPGQTWGSQFGSVASAWEECRAEAVGLYLCTEPQVLSIFGHEGEEGSDVAYVNWVAMARAGLAALPYYEPSTNRWGQAHMQARYALLRMMLEAGQGFVRIEETADRGYVAVLDRQKIATVGRPALAVFLQKLNVLKATADVAVGRPFFEGYTSVPDDMLTIRSDALQRRKPRHIWVQPVLDQTVRGDVILRQYPGTNRGLIGSFLDRYEHLTR